MMKSYILRMKMHKQWLDNLLQKKESSLELLELLLHTSHWKSQKHFHVMHEYSALHLIRENVTYQRTYSRNDLWDEGAGGTRGQESCPSLGHGVRRVVPLWDMGSGELSHFKLSWGVVGQAPCPANKR